MKPVAVYDGISMKRLCYLQNAYDISYVKHTVELWTGSFTLPYNDPKNKYCTSMNLVEIWDIDSSGKDKYIGLFRIMPYESDRSDSESTVVYTLEHVLATLIDDTMRGWVEIGNLGVYTGQVISYVLSRQSVKKWVLGTCDYTNQYLYGWQDEFLLSALYSVTNSLATDDCRWEFDTKKFPWTLSLKRVSKNAVTDIRYKKNINGIRKSTDPSNLTTRLYCYGFGDADNRLNLKSVNNGLEYIDSPNIAKYGVLTREWTDERFTNADSLLKSGKAMLKALEEPIVSYSVDIATVRKAADLEAGDMVRVVDGKVDYYDRVVEVSKDDVSGNPLKGKVILANKTTDIAQSVADMTDRQRIATTYSQGAESLFADSLYDNADNANPAELSFTVPENAVHVNEILLTAKLTNFRAFSKATKGGGAVATSTKDGGSTNTSSGSGGSSEVTSQDGGSSQQSSSAGGNSQQSSSAGGGVSTSSGSGGGSYESASSAGGVNTSTNSGGSNTSSSTSSSDATSNIWTISGSYSIPEVTQYVNYMRVSIPSQSVTIDGKTGTVPGQTVDVSGHAHGVVPHYHPHSHNVNINIPSHAHNFSIGNHSHSVYVPSHVHSVYIESHQHTVNIPSHQHYVNIPNHQHRVSIPSHVHSVTIPSHTHDISLPDHIHDIAYGIYKGGVAYSMTIAIDNVVVGTFVGSVNNINLIAYMSKNANGEVLRGQHVIKITPNQLTRVECAIQIRLFTNAHGAGQY